MATLTISLAGSTVAAGSRAYTVSNADLAKLLAWARTAYPSTSVPDTRTNSQVMLAWTQGWIVATRDAVRKRDVDTVIASAAAGVTPIGID